MALAAWLPSNLRRRRDPAANLLWAAFPVVSALLFLAILGGVFWRLAASLHGQKVASEAALLARRWEQEGASPLKPRGYVPILVASDPFSREAHELLDALSTTDGLADTCVLFGVDNEEQRHRAEQLAGALPRGTRVAVLMRPSVVTIKSATAPHGVSADSARVRFLLSVAFEAMEAPAAIVLDPRPEGWAADIRGDDDGDGADGEKAGAAPSTTPQPSGREDQPLPAPVGAGPALPAGVIRRGRAALPSDEGPLYLSRDALRFLFWARREVERLPPHDAVVVLAVDGGARAAAAGVAPGDGEAPEAGGGGELAAEQDAVERASVLGPTVDGGGLGWWGGLRPDVAVAPASVRARDVGVDGQMLLVMGRHWGSLSAGWEHERDWRDEVASLAASSRRSVLAPVVRRMGRGAASQAEEDAMLPRGGGVLDFKSAHLLREEAAEPTLNLP